MQVIGQLQAPAALSLGKFVLVPLDTISGCVERTDLDIGPKIPALPMTRSTVGQPETNFLHGDTAVSRTYAWRQFYHYFVCCKCVGTIKNIG
jgi:hypothetical protein